MTATKECFLYDPRNPLIRAHNLPSAAGGAVPVGNKIIEEFDLLRSSYWRLRAGDKK